MVLASRSSTQGPAAGIDGNRRLDLLVEETIGAKEVANPRKNTWQRRHLAR
jgi:hypothetical protein